MANRHHEPRILMGDELIRHARCSRCGRRIRNETDERLWNVDIRNHQIVAFICPDCQTDVQDLEAQINSITASRIKPMPIPPCTTIQADGNGPWAIVGGGLDSHAVTARIADSSPKPLTGRTTPMNLAQAAYECSASWMDHGPITLLLDPDADRIPDMRWAILSGDQTDPEPILDLLQKHRFSMPGDDVQSTASTGILVVHGTLKEALDLVQLAASRIID